jgi:chitin disaccharide deacetylase
MTVAIDDSRAKELIVNGDDFGRSLGINTGILQCHDEGILTSASLMTLWPASAAAAAAAKARPELSIGLHVDLGEWIYADDLWKATYIRAPLDDEQAVRAEVQRQLLAFRRMLDREPTHLDSHQHVHRSEPVKTILAETAAAIGIPLRHFAPAIRYCGSFFGQSNDGVQHLDAISVEALAEIIGSLLPGATELACHPGYPRDVATAYRVERELEIGSLCDRRIRCAIDENGVELRSFYEPSSRHRDCK